jgi:hypothetical protein
MGKHPGADKGNSCDGFLRGSNPPIRKTNFLLVILLVLVLEIPQ